MEYIEIPDTAIVSIHCGKQNNGPDHIIYRDQTGNLHTIDFEVCARNFLQEHPQSSGNCIGLRKADEHYFIFYTSGQKTKIVFKKLHVYIYHRPFSLTGSLVTRFLSLWCIINKTKYTTYDLS